MHVFSVLLLIFQTFQLQNGEVYSSAGAMREIFKLETNILDSLSDLTKDIEHRILQIDNLQKVK